MPKILPNLRETILKCGKDILLNEGYAELTMRKIATECKIAVGTIYSYYESKEYLCAAVMLEDWSETLELMKDKAETAETAIEGLKTVFDLIKCYSNVYTNTWKAFSGSETISEARHNMLITQLISIISPLLDRFGIKCEHGLDKFVAEVILSSSVRQYIEFDEIRPFIIKLIY